MNPRSCAVLLVLAFGSAARAEDLTAPTVTNFENPLTAAQRPVLEAAFGEYDPFRDLVKALEPGALYVHHAYRLDEYSELVEGILSGPLADVPIVGVLFRIDESEALCVGGFGPRALLDAPGQCVGGPEDTSACHAEAQGKYVNCLDVAALEFYRTLGISGGAGGMLWSSCFAVSGPPSAAAGGAPGMAAAAAACLIAEGVSLLVGFAIACNEYRKAVTNCGDDYLDDFERCCLRRAVNRLYSEGVVHAP